MLGDKKNDRMRQDNNGVVWRGGAKWCSMAFEFVSSGRCPSDILLPFQGEEVGGVTFTQGGALGYVLLPLRGEAGINGGGLIINI